MKILIMTHGSKFEVIQYIKIECGNLKYRPKWQEPLMLVILFNLNLFLLQQFVKSLTTS